MGQGDPGRQHQAAGMKSRPKIGKTFHNVSFGEIDTNRSGIGLARVGRPLGQRVTLITPLAVSTGCAPEREVVTDRTLKT